MTQFQKRIYIRTSKINPDYAYDIQMIYSWAGAKQELLVFSENLTYFVAIFATHRNLSIGLHGKIIDWFLREGNIVMEKVR